MRVGVYLKPPNLTTPDTWEAIGEYFNVFLREELERLPAVDVAMRDHRPTDPPAAEREWLVENRIDFYFVGEYLRKLEDGWPLKWQLYDLRGYREKPRAEWPKTKVTVSRLRDKAADIEERAKDFRNAFAHAAGIRPTTVILISCFQGVPGKQGGEEEFKLRALEASLPATLHVYLQKAWENRGYEARVLDPSNIQKCCMKQENTEWLNTEKLKADYVIEGVIVSAPGNVTKMTLTISKSRGAQSSEDYSMKGSDPLDPIKAPEDLARFIQKQWPTFEKRFQ